LQLYEDTALDKLKEFLGEFDKSSEIQYKIICGKGKGILFKAVWDFLA
jgi:dsDNA-specific endonuclease/ATPase MutS2